MNLHAAGALTVVSAATDQIGPLAPESLAAAFGTGLEAPVVVTGSAGTSRAAPVFPISATQVNFEIPAGNALGPATVTVGNAQAAAQIAAVSPGLFRLAVELVSTAPDGTQTVTPATAVISLGPPGTHVTIGGATPADRATQIVSQMTLDEKITELHGIQDNNDYRVVPGVARLGIPALDITP